jgi:energy-coupling factor transport system permease protein
LETSLDQSIDLAASMDVRGFGRAAEVTPARRRRATLSLAIGAIGSAMTLYAVLSPGVDTLATVFAGVGAIGGLGWSIRELGVTNPRTTYRRIPFTPVSSVMATVAVGAVLAIELGRRLDPLALEPPIHPLALPKVPWWFFGVALLVAAPVALANDRPTRDEQIGDAPINDAEWAQHRLSEQSGAR